MSQTRNALKFAYWVPNVSGGLVISNIKQRTSWTIEYHRKLAQGRCHLNLNSIVRETFCLGVISGHGSGRGFPLCDRLDAVNAVLECGAL